MRSTAKNRTKFARCYYYQEVSRCLPNIIRNRDICKFMLQKKCMMRQLRREIATWDIAILLMSFSREMMKSLRAMPAETENLWKGHSPLKFSGIQRHCSCQPPKASIIINNQNQINFGNRTITCCRSWKSSRKHTSHNCTPHFYE